MQRGVINVTKNEIIELVKHMNLQNYADVPLGAKFEAILNSQNDEVRLEISEDEAEILLDPIAIPTQSDSELIRSLRLKLQTMLQSFRNNG